MSRTEGLLAQQLRIMLYKELMEWKRKEWELTFDVDSHISIAGVIWDRMRITKGDKEFIESQIAYLIHGDISKPKSKKKSTLEEDLSVDERPINYG